MVQPELSVVIPVYNNWWLTARCLRELDGLRDRCGVAFETIVVDNASTDETRRAISEFSWVRYFRHDENRNFAGACNAGARMAQAPLTFFLNNDAYPLGDALTPIVRIFEREEVTIAGGALFFEDGVTQAAGLVMLPNGHWHYSCRNLPSSLRDVREPRDAVGVSGAAMAVRTAWFLNNGGFDETFINGFEDVDLCLRAREESRIIAYVADSRFAHYEAASENRFASEAENEHRFYTRWSSKLAALPKTLRGDVGAIAIHARSDDPLLAAAREDLEQALRAFGHPVVHGEVAPWRRLDRRFRRAASIGWFTTQTPSPGLTIDCGDSDAALIRTWGACAVEVSWLPCASTERLAAFPIRRSDDPEYKRVGLAGSQADVYTFQSSNADLDCVPITPEVLLGQGEMPLACLVHLGLTDSGAFGNVLLAQTGVPAVVMDRPELRALFSSDVATIAKRDTLAKAAAYLVADPGARARDGTVLAADARRRFAPRRSAIRVVDLLCAARFGLERQAKP